jgi:predicted acetyltransferase
MAGRVRAAVLPDDPVGWLTREPDVEVEREPWMLRIVDAPAAIAGRGFAAGAEFAVQLRLDDQQRPGHAGRWTLEVSGGRGALHRAVTHPAGPEPPAGPVRLGARGFAALYAGIAVATLRRSGLAAGGDARADEALDGAFAGQAFLLDDF